MLTRREFVRLAALLGVSAAWTSESPILVQEVVEGTMLLTF